MTKSIFKLQKFDVAHGQSTMKVGTDAMILGAFVEHESPIKILDIGTGSGILALMMAQKFPNSAITAIDIHQDSIQEAQYNFDQSPFTNLKAIHCSLQDLNNSTCDQFDLIISNPPFFKNDLKSSERNRNFARHNDQLSFEDLIRTSANLLTKQGCFWFILPTRYHYQIESILNGSNLFFHQLISLRNDNSTDPFRYIYKVSKEKATTQYSTLNVRIDGKYSQEYIELTKDFHDRKL